MAPSLARRGGGQKGQKMKVSVFFSSVSVSFTPGAGYESKCRLKVMAAATCLVTVKMKPSSLRMRESDQRSRRGW